jgi:hypothetical protein
MFLNWVFNRFRIYRETLLLFIAAYAIDLSSMPLAIQCHRRRQRASALGALLGIATHFVTCCRTSTTTPEPEKKCPFLGLPHRLSAQHRKIA